MKDKLCIGVLMGGRSIEKEISFNSGRTVCDHIDTTSYNIVPLFQTSSGALYVLPWHFLHRGKISDFENRLATEAQKISWDDLKNLIDFMYIACHGKYSEDGILQGLLEVLQIPYLGSKVMASAVGMDKIFQKKLLASHNITVPNYITIEPEQLNNIENSIDNIINQLKKNNLTLPCIIKPYKEGSSLGITVAHDKETLINAINKACFIDQTKPQTVLVEEFITGIEFTCIVILDAKTKQLIALPPTEIVPEKNTTIFDYDQKYMPGRAAKFTPARLPEDIIKLIQNTSIQATKVLEFTTISRIDGFVTTDNKIVITDPNSLCGMSPSSFIFQQAAQANMSHTQLINHLIETELSQYNMLDPNNFEEKEQNQGEKMEHKIKVAVLLGGRSNEKEISLESGRNIVYKLSPHKYEPVPIFVDSELKLHKINQNLLVKNSTYEITQGLTPDMSIKWQDLQNMSDFVFIALHGGEGENGCVQGTLEMLSIPYNGSSVLTSALCINKYKTNKFLESQGFDVPKNLLLSKIDYQTNPEKQLDQIESLFSYPVIAKPHNDGCSMMVKKANNKQELTSAIESVLANSKDSVFLEEYICGIELTVGVIGNSNAQALPPSHVVTSGNILSIEEKFLPGQGENQTPAALSTSATKLVQDAMVNAYKALGCKGYARIDCFYQTAQESDTDSERVIIIEVNTLPGMTPATCIFHQAAEIGLKPMDFINLIVELGLEEHKLEKLKLDSSAETAQKKTKHSVLAA